MQVIEFKEYGVAAELEPLLSTLIDSDCFGRDGDFQLYDVRGEIESTFGFIICA